MKKPQLFLLHFAGGSSSSFQFMIPLLKNFSVFTLELPGRGFRIDESLKKNFYHAAEDINNQILSRLDGSNFIIYGHSMGANLGLKVTELLEKANKPPTYLFVSGSDGPTLKSKKRYLLNNDDLKKELEKFGGVPPEVLESEDFLDFYLPILRADFEVAEKDTYVELIVDTPIYAMMGKDEEDVDNIENWTNFTKSTFNYRLFEGGHFFIFNHSKEIVRIITETYYARIFV
ncbi:MAG: alpha/beta fold hydrolase [Bacteroidota bacterium]